jgi:tetratricopeptide (TPR) repeat protein
LIDIVAKKEKTQSLKQYQEALKENPQRIFLIVMAVLLVLRLALWSAEGEFSTGELAKPQQPALSLKITRDSEDYERVSRMATSWPEFQQSDLYELVEFNMFDPKRVMSALQIQQDVLDKTGEGWVALESRQDFAEATRIVRDLLEMAPNDVNVKELRDALVNQNVARARTAIENEDFEQARQILETSLVLAPEHPRVEEMQQMMEQVRDELDLPEPEQEEQPQP